MKFALLLLVALPMVLCVDDRSLLDGFAHLFDSSELHKIISSVVDKVGSDATEAQCESVCHTVVHSSVFGAGCPLVCKSFQSLVHHFGLH